MEILTMGTISKPVWLAFRPDLTPFPQGFTNAVIPIYSHTDWADMASFLRNQMKAFVNIAAIDAKDQAGRLTLIEKAVQVGFSMIELDEQISDTPSTLTAAQLDEINAISPLPVGVTSTPGAINHQIAVEGIKPQLILTEFYGEDPLGRVPLIALLRQNYSGPMIGVVDLRDLAGDGTRMFDVAREVWDRMDGVWFWGLNTANPSWNEASNKNLNTLRSLLNLFGRP